MNTHTNRGKDFHRTLEAAMERAEAMRRSKIAALERQLKKLHAAAIKITPLKA